MKVWTYLVVMTGLMIFLTFAGFSVGGNDLNEAIGLSYNVNNTLQNATITSGSFFTAFFGTGGVLLLIIAATGGLLVGFLTKTSPIDIALVTFITAWAIKWIAVLIGLINYAINSGSILVSSLMLLIFVPFTIGFIVAAIEWTKGRD